ncbi:sigma-70 family RNA polymerase sigma factor [Solicola gregarius]|uniref:Sigma-70 family RNA polymerase sigma factor n=1 Tax=Solicola gregarius TaxID=2908642 RepID=A0AA46YMT6_9ACTN|nr:sigma-70 family RNA polymerase sigma factor [Solicola gregarius]UYM06944.1 sigma-70 family RNA polymerase sigma factor [Solicola gregarius]
MILHAAAQPSLSATGLELAIASSIRGKVDSGRPASSGPPPDDDPERSRIVALVDLAKGGDSEAFGELYDHYADQVFRYVYYRVGDRALAEDLTGDVFVRALRALPRFTWQGTDFGAWLTTIARNLITDHYKSSRTKREIIADQVPETDDVRDGPEQEALANDAHDALMRALHELPSDQQECLISRFILEQSIAETAALMGRSPGAIKQLQLRAIRALARTIPGELR